MNVYQYVQAYIYVCMSVCMYVWVTCPLRGAEVRSDKNVSPDGPHRDDDALQTDTHIFEVFLHAIAPAVAAQQSHWVGLHVWMQ